MGLWPEDIHNEIIDSAFSDFSKTIIKYIKKGSADADSAQNQDLNHSYMHAMRCPGQTIAEAQMKTEKFIDKQFAKYENKLKQSKIQEAYEALGEAMHPVMDSTSPSHEGFQEWKGTKGFNNKIAGLEHWQVEQSIKGRKGKTVKLIRKKYRKRNEK
jgi:hypothetical protein